MTKITGLTTRDLRFSTPRASDGSDAMSPALDHPAACVVLETDRPGLEGQGSTFTTGRGTEICVAAVEALRDRVVGGTLASITCTSPSSTRWRSGGVATWHRRPRAPRSR